MRQFKVVEEYVCSTESEAKAELENFRENAKVEGYLIGSIGYTYKTKKAKGEIVGEAWILKVQKIYGEIWEDALDV